MSRCLKLVQILYTGLGSICLGKLDRKGKILEGEETKDERNGRLILEQNGTGTDLGRSAGNEGAGKYRIDLYSDQEGTKTGQYFRYSRKN